MLKDEMAYECGPDHDGKGIVLVESRERLRDVGAKELHCNFTAHGQSPSTMMAPGDGPAYKASSVGIAAQQGFSAVSASSAS